MTMTLNKMIYTPLIIMTRSSAFKNTVALYTVVTSNSQQDVFILAPSLEARDALHAYTLTELGVDSTSLIVYPLPEFKKIRLVLVWDPEAPELEAFK